MKPELVGEDYKKKVRELKDKGILKEDKNGCLKNVRVSSHYERPLFPKTESIDKRETSEVRYIQINAKNTYKQDKKILIKGLLERL